MRRELVIRPYYSRAFGDQFIVVPLDILDELGLMDYKGTILDRDFADRNTAIVRFDTRKQAERYLASVTKADDADTG